MSQTLLSRTVRIANKRGLHARASAKFVTLASGLKATVRVHKVGHADNEVVGTSIMGLMMLAASPGCSIRVTASGPEAQQVMDALEALISARFGEEI